MKWWRGMLVGATHSVGRTLQGSADVHTGPSTEFILSEAEGLRTGSAGGDVTGLCRLARCVV